MTRLTAICFFVFCLSSPSPIKDSKWVETCNRNTDIEFCLAIYSGRLNPIRSPNSSPHSILRETD